MTRVVLLLALILLAKAAKADCATGYAMGGDTVSIGPHEVHHAVVFYSNSAANRSSGGTRTLCWNGTLVDVEIFIGGMKMEFKERITVTPHDPGLIAYPVEVWLHDGESARIAIQKPMF